MGWTRERAEAQLQSISPSLFQATAPTTLTPVDTASYLAFKLIARSAQTGVSSIRGAYSTPLWVLLGVTAVVLLIACANLANLMFARAAARSREVAIRLAIGASRLRLVRQMLCESLLLAALGSTGGWFLAQWFSRGLVAFLNTDSSSRVFVDLAPGWRVFAFMSLLTGLACVLFGLTPALRITHTSPGDTMKAGGRGTSDAREGVIIRRGLVVLQVALSLVLVVGALLLGGTLRKLTTLDPGFVSSGVLMASLDLRHAGIPPERQTVLVRQIIERVRAIPGVRSAAQAFLTPVNGGTWNNNIVVDGTVAGLSNFNSVGRGFFRTLGTPVVAGRDFDDHDDKASARVAIVNETFARQFLNGRSPVGQTFQIEEAPGVERTHFHIVGVVKDTKYSDLREPFGPIAYVSLDQDADPSPFPQIVVSSDLPLASVSSAVTQIVSQGNPNILLQYQTMTAQLRGLAAQRTSDGNALGILCGPGCADCRHRALRRDVVHGRATSGGNRHPHGPRGRSGVRGATGDARGSCSADPRSAHRRAACRLCRTTRVDAAVPAQTLGSGNLCRRPSRPWRWSASWRVGCPPGAPRASRQRSRCAASRRAIWTSRV